MKIILVVIFSLFSFSSFGSGVSTKPARLVEVFSGVSTHPLFGTEGGGISTEKLNQMILELKKYSEDKLDVQVLDETFKEFSFSVAPSDQKIEVVFETNTLEGLDSEIQEELEKQLFNFNDQK